MAESAPPFPVIRNIGLDGMLVTFASQLSEPSNRAALAFHAELQRLVQDGAQNGAQDGAQDGIAETSTSLASAFVRFDPLRLSHTALHARLSELLHTRNWFEAEMPAGRTFWRIPCLYGTDLAPQLAEAADEAGLSETQAIERLGTSRVRVLAIGFAPGQPYLGPLGAEWNLPRLKALQQVPAGALVQAISQFVLFTGPAPTGWRHVGQTAFSCFRPGGAPPIPLTPGDEVVFEPVSQVDFLKIRDASTDGVGGAIAVQIDP